MPFLSSLKKQLLLSLLTIIFSTHEIGIYSYNHYERLRWSYYIKLVHKLWSLFVSAEKTILAKIIIQRSVLTLGSV